MKNKRIFKTDGSALKELLLEPPLSTDFRRKKSCRQYLVILARIILAAVFIYAAFGKINKPMLFSQQIKEYGIFDGSFLLYTVAVVLPWIELLCGISLITGIFIRGTSLVLTAINIMFLIFIIYRVLNVMSSGDTAFFEVFFDCGCGFKPTYAWKKILENTALVGLSLILLFSREYRFVSLRSRDRQEG
ncbi:MAG: MauE/DoxX family redox-associated membrane protein [Candidatus Krumholzibacteriota bacterium]|nr:MauE/DoxX family redox-associated membrane protein [Candidatus Krumholzibacteriota bacterium]